MKYKKNKFFLLLIFNIFLLLIIILLAIPTAKYLSKINLSDNEFVKGQKIINPEIIPPQSIDRTMSINFVAEVDSSLKWELKALNENINLKIGENQMIMFEGKNLSDRTITATADFFASPETILPYLIKTECFCFTEQTLKPSETQIFTMIFYLDPALDTDWYFDDLKELMFTYKFSEYKN